MKKGALLRKITMLIAFILLILSAVNTTYGFIVIATEPVTNTFLPDDVSISSFVLNKTVEHPLGDSYKIPDNIAFDFRVELGSYYANTELTTSAGKVATDENGGFTARIRAGERLAVQDIEAGTVVTVTEQETSLEGFSVSGEATRQVTVEDNGVAAIEFVNLYKPAPVNSASVSVSGVKLLEGRDWNQGDSFTFVLEQKKGDSWEELGRESIAYSSETADFNRFSFSDIFDELTFDQVGSYTFRISESIGALEDIDYDKTVNHFTLLVTDVDMDGSLEINRVDGTENTTVSETAGNYSVVVTFNNRFIPPVIIEPEPISVQVDVNKTVKAIGNITHGADGFEFVLENSETAERLSAVSDEEGKAGFLLNYTKADIGKTHTYSLSETDTGIADMTYDESVYLISVSVSLDGENKLIAALTLNGAEVDSLNAEFVNSYTASLPDSPPTGDVRSPSGWMVIMLVSGAVLIYLILSEKKKRKI